MCSVGNLEINSAESTGEPKPEQLERPDIEPRQRHSPRAATRQSSVQHVGPIGSPPQPRQRSPYINQRRKVWTWTRSNCYVSLKSQMLLHVISAARQHQTVTRQPTTTSNCVTSIMWKRKYDQVRDKILKFRDHNHALKCTNVASRPINLHRRRKNQTKWRLRHRRSE